MGQFARFLILGAMAAASVAAAARSQDVPAEAELIDLTDEYAEFWEKSRSIAEADKVAAFKAYFDPLIPGFFKSKYSIR